MPRPLRIVLVAGSDDIASRLTEALGKTAGETVGKAVGKTAGEAVCLRAGDEVRLRDVLAQDEPQLIVYVAPGSPALLDAIAAREQRDVPLLVLADSLQELPPRTYQLGAIFGPRSSDGAQLEAALAEALRVGEQRAQRRHAAAFEIGQREILEAIARGVALSEILERIVLLIERQAEGMTCSLVLIDQQQGPLRIKTGAAPHLPPQLTQGIDGAEVGPQAGSCGAAAYLREPVVIEDIATHPNWAPYRHLALPHGLVACWSTPIIAAEGDEVLGTFAMYYREARGPTEREIRWVGRATYLAAIALAREQAISERRRAEERISSQARLLDQAKDAILVRDLDGVVHYWNQGAARLYGWSREEALGRDVRQLIYDQPQAFDQANDQVISEGTWTGDLMQITKGRERLVVEGSWTLVRDDHGQPRCVLAINSDVSERKRLEAALLRGQRLESLGTLAGGIAHDFNNLLAAMVGNLEMAQREIPEQHPARESLSEIERATAQATGLVSQILTFSRKREVRRVVLQLAPLVRDSLKLLQAARSALVIETRFDVDLPSVLADASQLQQVVMNLGTNAAHAMGGQGTLRVRAQRVVLEQRLVAGSTTLEPGEYARLSFADTGCGMDAEILDRIFDPFFTTKSEREGTGLGLSVVHGIVENHQGGIVVDSEPGRGTEFHIYLPAAETLGAWASSHPPAAAAAIRHTG